MFEMKPEYYIGIDMIDQEHKQLLYVQLRECILDNTGISGYGVDRAQYAQLHDFTSLFSTNSPYKTLF